MFRSGTYRSHDFLLGIALMLHGSVKLSKLQNTINTESPCCVLCHCFQEKERIEQDTLQQARDVSGEKQSRSHAERSRPHTVYHHPGLLAVHLPHSQACLQYEILKQVSYHKQQTLGPKIFFSLLENTVDWENFAVKIILRLRPTAKIKHAKNKITW